MFLPFVFENGGLMLRSIIRSYSPVPHLLRQTTEDIVMPLSTPIRGLDGTIMNEIPVPKATPILIGLLASNRNTQLWGPDAEQWKPERWLNPLPLAVKEAHIPGVYSHLCVVPSALSEHTLTFVVCM